MNILIRDTLALTKTGIEPCDIYIEDGWITSIAAAPEGFAADKTIPGSGRLVIPGLINAHTHVYMTIFRNCADDLLFNDWLFGKILPLEEQLTPDDCYWGTMLGFLEMIRTGTTSFIDMYIYPDAAARATLDAGLNGVLSRGLNGGADDISGGETRLRQALDEIKKWSGYENIHFMLAPHAPYTCDAGYQREVGAEAKRLGLPINTHLAESLGEIETIRERYGVTPIELADQTGLLSDTTVAAHCVHLTDSDIGLLAARGVTVATNPVSNLKLSNGVAPVPKLLRAGVTVALGTDGAASNNALNMFRDLSVLSLIHKGVNHDARAITAPEALRIATKNGAKAIGDPLTGEIAPGMRADLAILNLDTPNMQPLNGVLPSLAYSATGHEVETVIARGRILMEAGEFLTIDSGRVYDEVGKICERIGLR